MNATAPEVIGARWPAVRWFARIGAVCVVAGGLVAAVTGPLELDDGSWLAAFLVLIAGVAPIGFGVGQALLASTCPSGRTVRTELIAWYLGVVATIVGTLVNAPIVASIGSLLVAGTVAAFLIAVRGATRGRAASMLYRVIAAVVLVSVPVGIVLSWARRR